MKLTRATLNNPKFLEALKKLRENESLLSNTAKLRVGVISQAVYLEMLASQADAKHLLSQWAMKDEKGEILGYPEQDKIKFESKYQEEHFDKGMEKMLKQQFKIDSLPITIESLGSVQLTTEELVALKPVLSDK